MMTKCLILVAALVAVCSGGNVPVAVPAPLSALTVGTYASSYNAHAVNHAIAAPYVAPAVAAHPFAYSAYPAFGAYSAPLIAGRR
ncbi:uncharacterized protein LOC124405168 isoform X2 [Diprion similis]|uniref:uncharacterized protein LOC124405168 isoform X2 n=1 Tax=Diprion similis TaxID=362088 RepID=UPI001EF99C9D|nr:uncharacterized protein LOC124405168 isoform X2 [Diprion similis]